MNQRTTSLTYKDVSCPGKIQDEIEPIKMHLPDYFGEVPRPHVVTDL